MAPRGRLRQELTNLPNLLTYARIATIPLILWFVEHDSPKNCLWAALIYSIASVTDVLDGFLARISGQVSMIGKFIDPLADKLIVLLLFVYLVPLGRVPPWVVAVVLTRELAVTGLRAIAAGEGLIISASDSAKMKTSFQLIGCVGLLIHYRYTLDLIVAEVDASFHDLGLAFTYMSVVLSVWSGFRYFRAFVQAVLEREESPPAR
jgi:CDP-diacylglycerol--glycerol-3-phosphate 3-phosphatidyltransferase